MATELLQGGGYTSASGAIAALNTAVSGASIELSATAYPPRGEVVKEGSSSWRYYFIYETS
jgi:hypothetical protein|tara:strand:- start:269 stop:451 length:183 start_codon:yes stop_codon:yes gene_type:complete